MPYSSCVEVIIVWLCAHPSCVEEIVVLTLCLASCGEVVIGERSCVLITLYYQILGGGSLCRRSCVDI